MERRAPAPASPAVAILADGARSALAGHLDIQTLADAERSFKHWLKQRKFRGVDVGTVKDMAIDTADPRRVRVDVNLRKDAPVKTDTKASLKLKGFTGVVVIELNGGSVEAKSLVAVTPENQIPEIASERSSLNTVLDQLPKTIEKFSALEDQGRKVLSDISGLTARLKENSSLLIFPPKEKDKAVSPRR